MGYLDSRAGQQREGRALYAPSKEYFVDATTGGNGNSGLSWGAPLLTMAAAFARIASGDRIYFRGKIREQLTTPVQIFDVAIIGAANRPRHADATPAGGESGATWTTPASGASTTTPLLKVIQQGWRIENFVMAGPSAAACVQTFRDGGADNAERDASHFEAHNVRFASGRDGIEDSGGCYNVGIFDCSFHDLTEYCVKFTVGAGIGIGYRWQFKRNRCFDCGKWILYPSTGKEWEIQDNVVVKITTPGIDTSGGAGGNVVTGNVFDIAAADFDPVGLFTADATDIWSNCLKDAIETGVPTN